MGDNRQKEETIERQMMLFEAQRQLLLPDDLKAYFRTFNAEEYETDMFFFFGLDKFESVENAVGCFRSGPDYRNIVNTLPNHENCFVFADYFIKICVYAIRLYKDMSEKNEIYVIMGDKFEILANSFREYLDMYRSDICNVLVF